MNLKQVCDGEATCPGEGCPHEVPVEHPSVAETMAEDALKPKDKPLTETQFRALRRAFFTVRHDRVPECGHRSDKLNEPRNNCEYCWFFWFSGHGELVQTADRAFQEQGSDFLTRMRGRKFTRMFVRFMATLAKFKEEAEANAVLGNAGGTEGQTSSILSEQQAANPDKQQAVFPAKPQESNVGNSALANNEPAASENTIASI